MLNAEPDTQIFVLWEAGRFAEHLFLSTLETEFTVLRLTEFQWTRAKAPQNFSRLYGEDSASSKGEWVGYGPFLCAIVRDNAASYDLRMTLSGKVKHLNTHVLKVKEALRTSTRSAQSPNNVHSSVNAQEFKEIFALLFGPESFQRASKNDQALRALPPKVDSDLAGSAGWDSLYSILNMLSATSEFALLRPASAIETDHILQGGDVDILLRDRRNFSFIVNALPRDSRQSPHFEYVPLAGGQQIKFDIREVGDGDLEPSWQREILDNRALHNSPFITISDQDSVPYLLFHNLVQLEHPKEKYWNLLEARCEEIAGNLNSGLSGSKLAWSVLIGFMRDKGFRAQPFHASPGFGSSRPGLAHLPADLGGSATLFNLGKFLRKLKTLRWISASSGYLLPRK